MAKKLSTPFANDSRLRNDVPVVASTDQANKGVIGYTNGFTSINKLPLANGGQPPHMEDFNGVLYDVTSNIVDINKGIQQKFDNEYATIIGGYPSGARLVSDDNLSVFLSTMDSNSNNPNTSLIGWVNLDKGTLKSYPSVSALPTNAKDGDVIYVESYYARANRGGGFRIYTASRASENDGFMCINGWVLILTSYELVPEQAGAVGDGVTDDILALQKVANYPLTSSDESKKFSIVGSGNYAVSSPVIINNYAYGFDFNLRGITAHENFPTPTDYKTASPLIQVGQPNIGGSMVGLDIKCTFVDGANKATWLAVVGYGAGGSKFEAVRLINCVNGVDCVKPLFNSASNVVKGSYWSNGSGIGVNVEKGDYIVEGWTVDVAFIAAFNVAGVRAKNAQYLKVIGQNDFNGKWCSEITLSSNSFSNLNIGDTITDGTNTAIVEAFYEQTSGVYKILAYEGQDATSASKFKNSASLTTSSGFSNSIKDIRLPASSNWYPDIIHDFYGQPFAKCIINVVYGGGVVGSLLYTSDIAFKSSYDSYSTSINGVGFASDGQNFTVKNTFTDAPAVIYGQKFHAPYSHLNMRNYRIYGQEVYRELSQGASTNIFTFSRVGDSTIPNLSETYMVTGSTSNAQVGCILYIFVSDIAIQIGEIIVNNMSISSNGMSLIVAQGAIGGVLPSGWNIQRIM